MRRILSLILLWLLLPLQVMATTYYVSKSTGSDSNAGTSKGAAWAHLPGMKSWTGSYTPTAGDTIVLKGCDIWLNADLPVSWNWSGSGGNLINIGVDKTWYNTSNCPLAWNRPVFNAGLATITPTNTFFILASSGNTSYGTVDNIEFKGFFCPSTGCPTYGSGTMFQSYNNTTNWTISNLYFHGWSVGVDIGYCIVFAAGVTDTGTTFETSVIDGSDTPGYNSGNGSCRATYPVIVPNFINNVIHDVANGIVGRADTGGVANVAGNLVYNIQPNAGGSHPNGMEFLGGTIYIHDNVLHDVLPSGAQTITWGDSNDIVIDLWNNVSYNNVVSNPFGPAGGVSQTGYVLNAINNTIVSKPGLPCFLTNTPYKTFTTVNIQNNHCITTAGAVTQLPYPGTTANVANNIVQTPTQAAASGYTATQTYAYSPTSGGSPTVGAGLNLTSDCSGMLAGLCSDTAYGVVYNQSAQTATVPGRPQTSRPSSTAWDSGAYQLVGAFPTASVNITPGSGTYVSPITVGMNGTPVGLTICYTTDGSIPTGNGAGTCTHGTTYSSPFSQSIPITIMAIGTASGYIDSPVTTRTYTVLPEPPTGLTATPF